MSMSDPSLLLRLRLLGTWCVRSGGGQRPLTGPPACSACLLRGSLWPYAQCSESEVAFIAAHGSDALNQFEAVDSNLAGMAALNIAGAGVGAAKQ